MKTFGQMNFFLQVSVYSSIKAQDNRPTGIIRLELINNNKANI